MLKLRIKRNNISDKHRPGHYIKVQDAQLVNSTTMATIMTEIQNTPAIRGLKIVLLWGRYETTQGVYNFAAIDSIVSSLRAMGKYLMISIAWREFDDTQGVTRILPPYLRTTDGVHTDTTGNSGLSHTTFKYAWAYQSGKATPNNDIPGYNIKLWDQPGDPNGASFLHQRIQAFIQALATRYDNDPVLIQMTTNESAVNTPVVTFGTGTNQYGSSSAQEAGQVAWVDDYVTYFTNTPIAFGLNFTRAFVNTTVSGLTAKKVGMNTPNCNWKDSINNIGGSPLGNPQGIIGHMLDKKGILHTCAEIQGDDLYNTIGTDGSSGQAGADFPHLRLLHERCIFIGNTYCIWQRVDSAKSPFWQGGVATGTAPADPWAGRNFGEGVLSFLRTNSRVLNGGLSGGMEPKKPSSFK